jgi:ribosome biogenesis GTPase
MLMSNENIHQGLVVKSVGNLYTVVDSESGQWVECRIKGRIRLREIRTTNPVAVGDIVEYEIDATGQRVITDIVQRRNYIIRRASNLSKESHIIAANLDGVFIVVTLDRPPTSREFIDRLLVTAEAYNVPSTIVLNKIDLYQSEELELMRQDFVQTYTKIGYRVLEVSAAEGDGMDTLRELLAGKVSLFTGNSGVGKSTLIGALIPDYKPRTGEISEVNNRGKHTTTFSEMYPLSEGGYIVDTPGIKGFGVVDIEPEEIGHYFPEIFRVSQQCQYGNCTHTHEPGCAVKQAVEDEEIPYTRYISYLKLMDDGGKYRR